MRDNAQDGAHAKVASVLAWSMQASLAGVGPDEGFDGLPFREAGRASLAGQPLANGYRLAYVGFKADLKARAQAHYFFERYYLCNYICESCFAARPHANPMLSFMDFSPEPVYAMTAINHEDYMKHHRHSPWAAMPGFRLETVFLDLMHILWLGTARGLYASALGYWFRCKLLGPGTLGEQLLEFSLAMKAEFKRQKHFGRS